MNISKPALIREILRAFALVIVGAAIITAVNVSLRQTTTPYYAVIANTRVETQAELKKQMGEITNDANSGTSAK